MKVNIIITFVTVCICLVLGEFLIKYTQFSSEQRNLGLQSYYNTLSNGYSNDKCSFHSTTMLHPQLSYIQKKNSSECDFKTSNIGLPLSHDLPATRDPEALYVLVLGGSVADLLATTKDEEGLVFERVLNQKFPGKKVVVINGAFGGWRMPNQLLIALKYASKVDYIVEVDGYNEVLSYQNFGAIDLPLHEIFYNELQGKVLLSLHSGLEKIRQGFSFLESSYFFTFIYRYSLGHTAQDQEALSKNLPEYNLNYTEQDSFSKKFKLYHQLIEVISDFYGVKYHHFLQPVRWESKKLTKKEASFVKYMDEKTIKIYKESVVNEKAINTELLSVFDHIENDIYIDHIHYNLDGIKIVAQKITDIIFK